MERMDLSIHAPAWGATTWMSCGRTKMSAFNPRTRVGCDSLSLLKRFVQVRSFNPRTRVGCDCDVIFFTPAPMILSIHAPAWGATVALMLRLRDGIFQSTHPRGVRHWTMNLLSPRKAFNPRTRVGCDCIGQRVMRGRNPFNPRTRVGCDVDRLGQRTLHGLSIHAPAWGATALPAKPWTAWLQRAIFANPASTTQKNTTQSDLIHENPYFNWCANLPNILCLLGVRTHSINSKPSGS